jgi:trk system potassium uptake protein TrkA
MPREKAIAVFGLGTFGLEVCRVLSEKGGRVIAVDVNPKLVDRVKDMVTQAILIDSTDFTESNTCRDRRTREYGWQACSKN